MHNLKGNHGCMFSFDIWDSIVWCASNRPWPVGPALPLVFPVLEMLSKANLGERQDLPSEDSVRTAVRQLRGETHSSVSAVRTILCYWHNYSHKTQDMCSCCVLWPVAANESSSSWITPMKGMENGSNPERSWSSLQCDNPVYNFKNSSNSGGAGRTSAHCRILPATLWKY